MLTLPTSLELIQQRETGNTVSPDALSQHSSELTLTVVSPVEFSAVNAKKFPQAFRVGMHRVRKFSCVAELKQAFMQAYPDHGNKPIVSNGPASVPLLPGVFASYETGALYLLAQRLSGAPSMYVMGGEQVEREQVLALCTGSYVERVTAKPTYQQFMIFSPALHNIVTMCNS